MNAHLMLTMIETLSIVGIFVLLFAYYATPGRAQSPSFAVAPTPAPLAQALQARAQGHYAAAIDISSNIPTSAAGHQNPTDAPEAIYLKAHIYRDNLHDPQSALACYTELRDTYGSTPYPHRAAAATEYYILVFTLDKANAGSPLYRFLNFFVTLTGSHSYSYPLAIFLVSLIFRLAMLPLTAKQFTESMKQRQIQPQMVELQKRYKDDIHEMTLKVRELQESHGINPQLGLLLGVVQMPFLYAMYHAVGIYRYHFLQGKFLWIGSALAARYPHFIGQSLGQFDLLLVVVYALTMVACQRASAGGVDDGKQRPHRILSLLGPCVMAFMLVHSQCVSAFILYWIISMVLSQLTQVILQRRYEHNAAVAC